MLVLASFMFIMGLFSFSLNRKHLLMMLLSLEFVVISLYFILFLYLINMNYEFFLCMIFITMSVCEGALGLGVLISMIRVYGNDYLMSFTLLW